MIRYTLACKNAHAFESWFPSSSSFDEQAARGLVLCPTCGSAEVEKSVMAPNVARRDREAPATCPAVEPEPAAAPEPSTTPMVTDPQGELRRLLRELKEHVVKSADYVGDNFADLARKMHDGEIEHRSIYGEATAEEVKALKEDEVEVFPLPILPEDRN